MDVKNVKKKINSKKHFNILKNKKLFLFLILFGSLLLGIGYAQVSEIYLDVNGRATVSATTGIYITKIDYVSNNNADPTESIIQDPNLTNMISKIVLGNDLSSSITYKVTIFNNTDIPKIYDDALYTLGAGYDNPDIEFELNGIQNGDQVDPGDQIEFNITFKYASGLSTITDSELNSIINYNFNDSSAVAKIGNNYYNTLQAAINAVPTNNPQTTIILLRDVSENLKVAENQNVAFNFQTHTVSVTSGILLENKGTVNISNGTLTSSSKDAAVINNESTGTLYISGGTISMTASTGKQAIYNNKGIIEISGSAYISSSSPATGNNSRATVQNLAQGTLTIKGGTIVSEHFQAVNNAGTLTVGRKEGTVNRNNPIIQGATLGINSTTNYSLYDGTIRGKTNAVNDTSKITDVETGHELASSTESIDGSVYKIAYLVPTGTVFETILFDANGGTVSETSREVENGTAIGPLPVPTWTDHTFDGWFTLATGGVQINEHTIITSGATYYAHWTSNAVAEYNGNDYFTLQAAINAVPKDNSIALITVVKDIKENVTIAANQNIEFDFGNHTLSNKKTDNTPVFLNQGTIKISNGNFTTSATAAVINNRSGGRVIITGGNISSTSDRQAIYNYSGGIIDISGTAYITSNSAGMAPSGESSLGRATIQNLRGGTVNINGGTIIGTVQQAISNEGTLNIGTKDGVISTTVPSIRGETYGIVSTSTLNFYDGVLKGITNPVSGTISDEETGSTEVNGTETINNKTYKTLILN